MTGSETKVKQPVETFDLREHLWSLMEEHGAPWVYALLDCNHPVAPDNPLHPARLKGRLPAAELAPILRPDRRSSPDTSPQLLVLRAPYCSGWVDEDLLKLTLTCALAKRTSINGAYVCGWLVAADPPLQMAQQVAQSMLWRSPSSQRYVLPWFEPYRWTMLADSPTFRAKLHQTVTGLRSWSWINCAGHLCEQPQSVHTAESRTSDSVVMDTDDWHGQQRVGLARQVLLALQKADAPLLRETEKFIDTALKGAESNGLKHLEDILCFAVQCVLMGPHWYRAPQARVCIQHANQGDTLLADSLDALDDKTIERIMDSANEATLQELA